ncbi:MAG TPA: hypothetical protein VGT99_09140 [Gammaproteobacteria bacterium]|nr:hypothetical protein [Gammaproteobacteria bacterium]
MNIATRGRVLLVAVIALLAGAGIWYASSTPPSPVEAGGNEITHAVAGILTADIPAAGVERVTLAAGSGEMQIKPSGDDAVHVRLELRQNERSILWVYHWMSGTTARDLEGATLVLDRREASLSLRLGYPGGASHDDVQQKWLVQVPSHLAVGASQQAGELRIQGMQAGVTAQLRYGDLEILGSRGPLHAGITAGRLHAVSESSQPGVVSVGSSFGLGILSLNGKYYGPPECHAFWCSIHLSGNTVVQQAGGKDDMDLKATFGLADLRIGPLGEEKEYRREFAEE